MGKKELIEPNKEEIVESKKDEKIIEPKKKKKSIPEELKFSFFEVLILIFITAVVSVAVAITINKIGNQTTDYKYKDKNIANFVDEYEFILNNYYGTVKGEDLIKNAIAGMVNSLADPYSTFIDGDDATNFDVELDGEFLGLGVEIKVNETGQIEINKVIENTGAALSDIQVGDIVTAMNGESISGLTTTAFRAKMLNSSAKTVNLTINRKGETKEISIERSIVQIPSVTTEVYKSGESTVGYLRISIFAANTYTQLKKALTELETKNIDSLIVDVRSNTGGHLSVVTDVISEFLDNTHVIYQIKDSTGVKQEYSTGKETKKYNMVVLIDGASASAAELFASAMQEQYGAKLMGTKSYGKSTVQEVVELGNGTKYKITIKEWLTSLGKIINGVGIKPDAEINLSEEYFKNPITENDNQLSEAIKSLKK